jgi:hypothetical protein
MGRGTNGWFVICVGDGVENKVVMAHDEANGRRELQGLMKHDELRNMGRLVPMKKKSY